MMENKNLKRGNFGWVVNGVQHGVHNYTINVPPDILYEIEDIYIMGRLIKKTHNRISYFVKDHIRFGHYRGECGIDTLTTEHVHTGISYKLS